MIACAVVLAAPRVEARPPDDDDDDEAEFDMEMAAPISAPRMKAMPAPSPAAEFDFEMDAVAGDMLAPEAAVESGATPGGVQDVNLMRALVSRGQVPRADQVTPEGFFSEHDLPLATREPCQQLLCVNPEVTDARLSTDPDRHYLVQLGFASNLDLNHFDRTPMHMIFVVDLSSSMQGHPLAMTQASIRAVIGRLGSADRVTLVGFTERAGVLVADAAPDDVALMGVLDRLTTGGLSHLEAGLGTGLEIGARTSRAFSGRTRVVLFSDDRPTYGRTGASPLIDQVRRAADQGVGLTTVGVGLAFDAGLAREVASVRGGSVLFFDDPTRMRDTFEREFDSMFLELAHELEVVVDPGPGMQVTQVYGLPPQAITRRGNGIALRVETVFSSSKKGAIYFAVDPVGRPNLPRMPARGGMNLGEIRLAYREVTGTRRFHTAKMKTVRFESASPGLARGSLLVDEALAIERAVTAHHEGRGGEAAAILRPVRARFDAVLDPELDPQRELLDQLADLLD